VSPTAYATEPELVSYLPAGATVSDAGRLLLRASELVDGFVRAPFSIDADTDLPTNETVADALRDATCAVVEQWIEVGEANDIDGLASTQISTGGFSGLRAPTLPPRAVRFLSAAGLLSVGVATSGCDAGCSIPLGRATAPYL
jgi:hypothetical protein